MRSLYASISVLALVVISIVTPSAHANHQVSRFCPECTDATIAMQRAIALTPMVRCNWPNGLPRLPIPDDLVCSSRDRDVLLVNPLTADLYAYRLRFEQSSNRHVLQTRTLSSDERQAARTTVAIYQELITTEFGSRSSTASNLQSTNKAGETKNSQECTDEPTALDHVLSPELREWMIDELRDQWAQILPRFDNRNVGVSRTAGISAGFGDVRLTVGWSSSPAPLYDVFFAGFGFDVSEVPFDSIVHSDIIVFRINDARMLGSTLLLDLEFSPELSRAAGVGVNRLLSGQAVVDHPCVLEKLAEFDQNNPDLEFRLGGPGGPLFDFPNRPGGAAGGWEVCSRRICATVCVDGDCECQFSMLVLTPC